MAAGVSPTGSARTSKRPLGRPSRALIRSVTVREVPGASGGESSTVAGSTEIPSGRDEPQRSRRFAPSDGPQRHGDLALGAGLQANFFGKEVGVDRGPRLGHFLGRGRSGAARAFRGHVAVDQKSVAHDGGLFLAVHREREIAATARGCGTPRSSPGDDGLACRPHESVSGEPKCFSVRRAKENRA